LKSEFVAAMRGMMEAVLYDTSWLSEDALRKIFTDKLRCTDGYTVRSILEIRGLQRRGWTSGWEHQSADAVTWGNRINCCRLLPRAYAAELRGEADQL